MLKIYHGEGFHALATEGQETTIEDLHLDSVELLLDRGFAPKMTMLPHNLEVGSSTSKVQHLPFLFMHIIPICLAKLLLDKGADMNELDSEGMTLLDYACSTNGRDGPNLAGTRRMSSDIRFLLAYLYLVRGYVSAVAYCFKQGIPDVGLDNFSTVSNIYMK